MGSIKPASNASAQAWVGVASSVLFVAFLGCGWAGTYTLNRLATTEGVPYLAYLFWQTLIGGIFLLIILAGRRVRPPMGRLYLRLYLVAGLLAFTIPYTAIVFAAPKAPVGVLTLEVTLEPMITYLLALLILIERFHSVRFAGIVIGVAGLMLIVVPQTSLPSRDMVPWVLLGLTAPLSWAGLSVWIARFRPPAVDSIVITCALLLVSTLLFLPAMLATGSWWWFQAPFGPGEWAVVGAGLANALLWAGAFECIRLAGPVVYSTWAYVGTPSGIVFGIVFFDESHSAWIWSALVLLLAGLFLVNRTTPQVRKTSTPGLDRSS